MAVLCDRLHLFNTELVKKITAMNDDELWEYLLANTDRIEEIINGHSVAAGFLYAYPHGTDWFKKHFLKHLEDYREGVIFSVVMDFCFEGGQIRLDPVGMCGFLDHSDSCDVQTSDEIMPPVDEDSEEAWSKKYFHLLEPQHVRLIIKALENNFENQETNTREDIEKIKEMREFCLQNKEYKVAYIFDGA